MKKEVILVPKDKCPLDVLAEIGKRTENAWIFLHSNAVKQLQNSDGVSIEVGRKKMALKWDATDEYPETRVTIDICSLNADWKPITSISASDIAFTLMPVDPEDIYFLKMAE